MRHNPKHVAGPHEVKMSQDKGATSWRQVLEPLRGDGAYASPALADDMERALRDA